MKTIAQELLRLTFIAFLISLCSCSQYPIKKYSYSYTLPVILAEDSIEHFSSTIYLLKKGKILIYELPYITSYSENGKPDLLKYDFDYLVIMEGKKSGWLINHQRNDTIKIENTDSILSKRVIPNSIFDSTIIPFLKDKKLVNEDKNSKIIRCLYNTPEFDSVILYFDKRQAKNLFTLSDKMDLEFSSKMISLKLIQPKDSITNPIKFKDQKYRTTIFSIGEIKTSLSEKELYLFKEFEIKL